MYGRTLQRCFQKFDDNLSFSPDKKVIFMQKQQNEKEIAEPGGQFYKTARI
jgi:hypothetical protein